jgi:NifU-like protein involved in Fe-S cluster formation
MPDDAFDEVQDMILEDAGKIFSPRLIELFMAPKNFGVLGDFDHYSATEGACGETVVMYLAVREGTIDRISFVADACGPTLACSSAVTCMAEGLSIAEAAKLTSRDLIDYLGGLPAHKEQCAEVAIKALQSVLGKVRAHAASSNHFE